MTASNGRGLPLEGIRVADFFWLIAGPASSRVLADFGAEVIKIESLSRVDRIREGGVQPPEGAIADSNGVFNDCNTNKRSISLNLSTPRGVELAKEIVRRSDVVTNNFTGDRMERWGLDYASLRAIRPDVIMLSMPVMGTTGPYVRYGAYGNGVIAFSGLSTNMGPPDRPPIGIAPLYSDFSAPYFATIAILAALHHRELTGEGQFIDLAQAESGMALLGTGPLEYTVNGVLPPRLGNRSRDHCPHGAYRCAGADRWCVIAVGSDDEWRLLCEAMARMDLATDPRFATFEARKRHEDALDDEIGAWTASRDPWQVMHVLQAFDVAAGVVEDLADMVVRDPHLPGNHLREISRAGESVSFLTHAQPMRLDGESPPLRRAPLMGEHNEYVFRELLGMSEDAYVRALADGAIY
ncbi:MAG: CoA transferase [Chloroflexi bacterium]|nr:CoA transferase [Chloroflexota bacterium]